MVSLPCFYHHSANKRQDCLSCFSIRYGIGTSSSAAPISGTDSTVLPRLGPGPALQSVVEGKEPALLPTIGKRMGECFCLTYVTALQTTRQLRGPALPHLKPWGRISYSPTTKVSSTVPPRCLSVFYVKYFVATFTEIAL